MPFEVPDLEVHQFVMPTMGSILSRWLRCFDLSYFRKAQFDWVIPSVCSPKNCVWG